MIECYDRDAHTDELIGRVKTTIKEMKSKKSLELIEPSKQKKSKYKNSGVLNIDDIHEFKIPSFVDFVTAGTEISFIVGVDYTGKSLISNRYL